MIRQKLDAKQADEVSDRVYRQLRRALHSGRLTEKEYNYWYKKFLVANAQKNGKHVGPVIELPQRV